MVNHIIHNDDFCLIINKPSNLLVHHSYYARNIEEDSLAELLRNQGIEAYPVHRLDRKTSGLILFAKKKKYVAIFQELFEQNQIEKKYFALLRGFVNENGIIDSPVKNDRGNYKEAETHFKCIQHIELPIPVEPYETARYSLVEFIPKNWSYASINDSRKQNGSSHHWRPKIRKSTPQSHVYRKIWN